MVTLRKILKDHSEIFELILDTSDNSALSKTSEYERVSLPEEAATNSLVFLSKAAHTEQTSSHSQCLWIITRDLWEKSQSELLSLAKKQMNSILICKNLQMGMAHCLTYFDRRKDLLAFPKGISPQSWIHPKAIIGNNVSIGPFTTIGPNVTIGQGSCIGPHCTIEGEVSIGDHCFLEGNLFIGRQTNIGHHCCIKPFAAIGTDGYGYVPTQQEPTKIPQVGMVVLEDYVDIGAGTCIDRATISQTRIGKGTKIDNLVHIAHNCDIGRYCFITAGFAIAGSSKIGDRFMTGGATSVADHTTIADNVVLAGASVVMGDIKSPGQYGGHPLQPMKQYLKTQVILNQLIDLKKQLTSLSKHLELKDQS